MKKIYLAIPYSGIEELSYKCANYVAGMLISEGFLVFSPISHSHPIWDAMKNEKILQNTYDTWLTQDKAFVEWCDEIFVVELVGEEVKNEGYGLIMKSKGVKQEIEWATEMGKPVKVIRFNIKNKTLEI
jgi:hypothetical protein